MVFPAGWVLSAIITLIYYKVTGLKPKEKDGVIGQETAENPI